MDNSMNQPPSDSARADTRRSLGQRGEAFVAARLEREGWTILERNWRHPQLGELDIVAQEGSEIVFVEVRARRGPVARAVQQALESVGPHKQARLARLAEAYLTLHDLDGRPWRVDVAAVGCERGVLGMELIRHALEW